MPPGPSTILTLYIRWTLVLAGFEQSQMLHIVSMQFPYCISAMMTNILVMRKDYNIHNLYLCINKYIFLSHKKTINRKKSFCINFEPFMNTR